MDDQSREWCSASSDDLATMGAWSRSEDPCETPLATRQMSCARDPMTVAPPRGPFVIPGPPIPATSGPPISPRQFMDMYLNLRVPYRDPVTGADTELTAAPRIYINQSIDSRRSNNTEKDHLVWRVREQMRLAEARRTIAAEEAHRTAIAHTFFGKGSPWATMVTLSYALTLRRTTPATLTSYCNDRSIAGIGLDCSGFVNQYLIHTGVLASDRYIPSFRVASRQKTKLPGGGGTGRAIEALDVLIWEVSDGAASNHIAIIDSLGSNPTEFVVCESSGTPNGLSSTTYRVTNADTSGAIPGGIFEVNRGLGGSGTSRVKIFSVN